VDPTTARELRQVLSTAYAKSTEDGYMCAARQFEAFCGNRRQQAWPAQAVMVAAWMIFLAKGVSMATVRKYMSGVRSAQLGLDMKWTLDGDFTVRRTMRSLLKKYGVAERALKIPVTICVALRMFKLIPGWPLFDRMCHDDRLFVCATEVAVLALLRGGEFCVTPGSDRPVLRTCDVSVSWQHSRVEVRIPRMKTKWWREHVTAFAYDPKVSSGINPVLSVVEYRRLSVVPLPPRDAAFKMASGSPMTKKWMVDRTMALCGQAGVRLCDASGARVPVRASSWRAGGVLGSRQAGLSDVTTKALGRWASNAYQEYSFVSSSDLQAATTAVVRAAIARPTSGSSFVVGAFNPSSIFEDA
jgi:hypothetical protein